MTNQKIAVQDTYADDIAICYGCGRNNQHGLHVRTFWDGEIGHATFMPRPEHTAFLGIVYGGLLASLIDCHSLGTAIGAMYDEAGRELGSTPVITCVTGNLNVSYKKPTPMGHELTLQTRVKELTEKKAIITTELFADGIVTVTGEVIAVRVPSRMVTGNTD
ncbi:MAG: PaaI family thioesterase [Chloroflexota bacterium]